MRSACLSEPRSSFPSRGFHMPAPTLPIHAPFISLPARPPEWVVGINPCEVVANNLAKLATSPLPSTLPSSSLVQTARRQGVHPREFLETLLTADTAAAQTALYNDSG
jgi:hypothetical protein